MKTLFKISLCYVCGLTVVYIAHSILHSDQNTSSERKPLSVNSEEHINSSHFEELIHTSNVQENKEPPKVYPNYYEDNLHGEWSFNITKHYPESETFKWNEPKGLIGKNRTGIGEQGAGFNPNNNETKNLMEKLRSEHNYNLLGSELMSLHRSLPDPRYDECKLLSYPKELPTTSVIIIFHNEAWTTLLRTVWSVVDRSPTELIKEIILVDDMSTWSFLKRPLDDYIETLPVRVKLIRNKKREGLIRARLIGAKHAEGQILTFLDGHIECCEGWLQPLLARIASDRSVIAVPLIDAISSHDMGFIRMETFTNGFYWSLIFSWDAVPERERIRTHNDKTAPVRTPTMVGCAFAMDRQFFFEIGSYDEGMDIWGSENMEMSLRVWQCGGSMEIVPCSHVAHLYRISTYSFGGDAGAIKMKNNIRLVEVWMPEVKDLLYAAHPEYKKYSGGNLTERIELKKRLKCKDFRWYLEHIYPESSLNFEFIHFGEIISPATDACLDIYYAGNGDPLKVISCHHQGGNQLFGLTKEQKMITSREICVGVRENVVISVHCKDAAHWKYDNQTNWIVHVESNQCMQVKEMDAILGKCDPANDAFNWTLNSVVQF